MSNSSVTTDRKEVIWGLDIIHGEALFRRSKDKVVFVIGATGTGKSRLAIDLATRVPAEAIDSDKMQVYHCLDIATNKVTPDECRGVSAADFLLSAEAAAGSVLFRGRLTRVPAEVINYDKMQVYRCLDIIHGEALFRRSKDKVVFVIGATGTGKSRLAIDLATRVPAEAIDSDKMQVYHCLDIATNKVTPDECRGVSAADFLLSAEATAGSVLFRGRLTRVPAEVINYDKMQVYRCLDIIHGEALFRRSKDKVVFVIGATGTGKSRLAIDLATRVPAEAIDSDKMQVYHCLDIATNKVTPDECRGFPHHLLGVVDAAFSAAAGSVLSRGRLPVVAGGSNSFVEALVDYSPGFRLRPECCFLWVDAATAVLREFVSERVYRMVAAGLVNEVRELFDPSADYSRGVRRAIGVDDLLRAERRGAGADTRARLLGAAVAAIKENTWRLAARQLQKIRRLHAKWGRTDAFHRLEAKMQRLIWASIFVAISLPLVGAAPENNTMNRVAASERRPNSGSIRAAIVFGMLIPLLFLLFCIFMQNRTAVQNPPDIMETFPRYLFSDTCPICIDKFQDGDTVLSPPSCAHIFHYRCIRPWVVERGQRTCPTCRSIF